MAYSKQGRPEQFSPEQVIYALLISHGSKKYAAMELGCSRKTVHNYIRRYPRVATALHEYNAHPASLAQLSLIRAVKRGSIKASIYVLRKLGGWDDPLSDNYGKQPSELDELDSDEDKILTKIAEMDTDDKVKEAIQTIGGARRRAKEELGLE